MATYSGLCCAAFTISQCNAVQNHWILFMLNIFSTVEQSPNYTSQLSKKKFSTIQSIELNPNILSTIEIITKLMNSKIFLSIDSNYSSIILTECLHQGTPLIQKLSWLGTFVKYIFWKFKDKRIQFSPKILQHKNDMSIFRLRW